MLGGMFKTPGHQKFKYRPKYYDPVKEELDERVRNKEIRSYDDKDALRMRISEGMKRNQTHSKMRSKSTIKANITIALIATILAMMAFLVLGNF